MVVALVVAPPILLSWAEVQQGTAGPHGDFRTVGRGQAHKLMQQMRHEMSGALADTNVRLVAQPFRDLPCEV